MEAGESSTPESVRSQGLTEVKFSDQRTPEQLERGTVCFKNAGILAVQVDADFFSDLLRREGLGKEEINQLEIIFRAGRKADRNLHGDAISGCQKLHQNRIEVYTTLVALQGDGRDDVYLENIPIQPGYLVESILHEMKHYIQEKEGEPAETFGLTGDEFWSHPLEMEARKFADDHFQEAYGWVATDPKAEPLPFEDNTGPDRIVGSLAKIGHAYDLSLRLTLIDADNPVIYLQDSINSGIFSMEESRVWDIEMNLKQAIRQARELVTAEQLGYWEFNNLMQSLAQHFQGRGLDGLVELCLSQIYQ